MHKLPCSARVYAVYKYPDLAARVHGCCNYWKIVICAR